MSDPIRKVWEKYKYADGNTGKLHDRDDFELDALSAIRAHVEARCVWTLEWEYIRSNWYRVGCEPISFLDGECHVPRFRYCPYCGAPIERKEAPDANTG